MLPAAENQGDRFAVMEADRENRIRAYEPFFGSWRMEEKIGEGTYGSTARVSRVRNGKKEEAVLKVISVPKNSRSMERIRDWGLGEAGTATYLRGAVAELVGNLEKTACLKEHRHILVCRDYEVKAHEEIPCWDILLLMEEETPLADWCRHHRVTDRELLRAAADLAAALKEMEACGLHHGDIHPGNVLVRKDGTFCLADAGIAEALSDTAAGESDRMAGFAAPEARGRGDTLTGARDLYAVGKILCLMAWGGELPPGELLPGEAPALPASCGEVPGAIIRKLCSAAPEDRYQTPDELLAALPDPEGKKSGKDRRKAGRKEQEDKGAETEPKPEKEKTEEGKAEADRTEAGKAGSDRAREGKAGADGAKEDKAGENRAEEDETGEEHTEKKTTAQEADGDREKGRRPRRLLPVLAAAVLALVAVLVMTMAGRDTGEKAGRTEEGQQAVTEERPETARGSEAGAMLSEGAEEVETAEDREPSAVTGSAEPAAGETTEEAAAEHTSGTTEEAREEQEPARIQIRIAEETPVYAAPGEEMHIDTLGAGETVQAEMIVNDSTGNLWAKVLLSDGRVGYIAAESIGTTADIPVSLNEDYATALVDLEPHISEYASADGSRVFQQSFVATNQNRYGIMLTAEVTFLDADKKETDTQRQTQYLGPGDHAVYVLSSKEQGTASAQYALSAALSPLGSEKKVALFSYELLSRKSDAASASVRNGSGERVSIALLCYHYDPKESGAAYSDAALLDPGEEAVLTAGPCAEEDKVYLYVRLPE